MSTADINLSKENKELTRLSDFSAGDTINVHVKIREGNTVEYSSFKVQLRGKCRLKRRNFTVRKNSIQLCSMPIFFQILKKLKF